MVYNKLLYHKEMAQGVAVGLQKLGRHMVGRRFDLGLYFALTFGMAVVIAGIGANYLWRQDRVERERAAEIDRVRIESLAEAMRDAAKAGPHESALAAWNPQGAVAAIRGRFVWTNAGGGKILWQSGLSPEVAERVAHTSRWNEWTTDGRNRASRGMMLFGDPPRHVLWARSGNDLFGAEFEGYPLRREPPPRLWVAGICIFAILLLILAAAGLRLVDAARKAREEDLVKTRFLDNVSHELKTPCASIEIWADLLIRGKLDDKPDKFRRALETIVRENARMTRLVEQLLDYAHLQKGTRRINAEETDVARLASDTVEEMRGDFEAHGISFANRAGGPCVAVTDADAVKQILVNMLTNARKYAADDGPVEVELLARDGKFVLRVSDRGPGMSPDAMSRAFERFYREHDELTATVGGLGLGLSISRELARMLGGDMTVRAREGGGCVFEAYLAPQPSQMFHRN